MILKALIIFGILVVIGVIVTIAIAGYSLNKHYEEEDENER